jgi:hypothetical protein
MKPKSICSNCGSITRPMRTVKGNSLIELILWLIFIIPGLLYSLWRLSTAQYVCRKCQNPSTVPLNTIMGRKLLKEMDELKDELDKEDDEEEDQENE